MKLTDLLSKIDRYTTVWISTSTSTEDCIYFAEVQYMSKDTLDTLEKYTVKEIYPERYPAISCNGISIIVEKED